MTTVMRAGVVVLMNDVTRAIAVGQIGTATAAIAMMATAEVRIVVMPSDVENFAGVRDASAAVRDAAGNAKRGAKAEKIAAVTAVVSGSNKRSARIG
jgi:hypothetical protein